MPRKNPAPQPASNHTARLLAFQAVLIAGLIAYALTQHLFTPNDGTASAQAPAPTADLHLLQQQPTLGNTGPRYDIVIDFECPHCNEFLSSQTYASILRAARTGQAQLNVTAAAFLNDRSAIKGSTYNCVAKLAGPAAALRLIPELKAPDGHTNYWRTHARTLGAQYAPEAELQTCIEDGALQEHANNAFRATGSPGVPAVYINGTENPWTHLGAL